MIFNKPYRVVVIDDDEDMLSLLWKYLSSVDNEEITFSVFQNPLDAMAFIDAHQVHIVVTDLNMEDTNGADVISRCLELEKGIQVIAISQDKRVMTAIDCYNRGACFYLDKPIRKELLLTVIQRCIENLDDWHNLIKDHLHHQVDKEAI